MSLRMPSAPIPVDLQPAPLTWLIPDLLPWGQIITLDGPDGVGKTRFAAKLAALATTGKLPGQTKPIHVHWLASFNQLREHALAPLREFGTDMDRLRQTHCVITEEDKIAPMDLSSHEQASLLMEILIPLPPQLVIIDEPSQLQNPASTEVSDLKFFWETLEILAQRLGHCFLILRRTGCHLTRADRLLHQLGSRFARLNLTLAWHPQDRTQRLLTVAKNQLGPVGMQHVVTMDRNVTWTELADDDHAKPIHQASPITWIKKKPGPVSKAHLIAQELLTLLVEPRPSREIEEHFVSLGHSKNSIRDAIKQLGLKSYRKENCWWLSLTRESGESNPEHGTISQEDEYRTATIATTSRLASQSSPNQVEELESTNPTSSILEVDETTESALSPSYSPDSEAHHEESVSIISSSSTLEHETCLHNNP